MRRQQQLLWRLRAAPAAESKPDAVQASAPSETVSDSSSAYAASPAARKLARERGIDLGQVQTLDPIGRIRQEDIHAHIQKPCCCS